MSAEETKTNSAEETKTNSAKAFYVRHPEKLKEVIECEICGGQYKYYNRSHHNKTKKHQKILEVMEKYFYNNKI